MCAGVKSRMLCLIFVYVTMPGSGLGLTVSEDFIYRLESGAPMVGAGGGSGWSGVWQGNESVLFCRDINLPYASPVQRERREESQDSGSLYSQTSNHRGVYRELASPVSGEIWFSYLFRVGGAGSGGVMFNPSAANATGGSRPSAWNVLLDGNDADHRQLKVAINGVESVVRSGLPGGNNNYFVLGRVVTGKEGLFQLWINPDLTGVKNPAEIPVAPDFSAEKVVMPDEISSLGISAYRGVGGSSVFRFDALRMSDGGGRADVAFAEAGGFFLAPDGAENHTALAEGFSPFLSNRRWLSTPVSRLSDGRLITLVDNGVVFSSDGMAGWSAPLPILRDSQTHSGSRPDGGGTLLSLSSGRVIVAWRDPRKPDRLTDYWDLEQNGPVEGASGDVWVTFSDDTGLSWAAPQNVLSEPGGVSAETDPRDLKKNVGDADPVSPEVAGQKCDRCSLVRGCRPFLEYIGFPD